MFRSCNKIANGQIIDFNRFQLIFHELLFSKTQKRNVKRFLKIKSRINLENYILRNIIKQYEKKVIIYVLSLMPQQIEREGFI